MSIFQSLVQEAGLFKGGKLPAFSAQDIIEFIFFPVVNEGCRVVAEGIVDKPADLDVATVLAMGFPPYRCAVSRLQIKTCSTWACCRQMHGDRLCAVCYFPTVRMFEWAARKGHVGVLSPMHASLPGAEVSATYHGSSSMDTVVMQSA